MVINQKSNNIPAKQLHFDEFVTITIKIDFTEALEHRNVCCKNDKVLLIPSAVKEKLNSNLKGRASLLFVIKVLCC